MKMPLHAFRGKNGNSPKNTLATAILVANAFIWYFYSERFLTETADIAGLSSLEISAVRSLSVLGTVVAALLGVFIIYRFAKRVAFLRCWMLTGVVLSIIPLFINIAILASSILYFASVGIYFGLGMPVSLAYFAATTDVGNRSKLGGTIFFIALLIVVVLGSFEVGGISSNALILAGCEAAGLALTIFLNPDEKEIKQSDKVSYRYIFNNRPFLLYFIPWIMLSLVNYVTIPMVSNLANNISPDLFVIAGSIETVLSGLLTVVFGFFADYMGRKRLVVAGFTLLGLGYASLGLLSGNILGWWFFTAMDGIAWGALYTVFLMTIWGDLAQGKSSEKYYALGFLPFLLSFIMQLLGEYLQPMVTSQAVFSFASIFLFLAVLPLAYAPETLNLKDREFKKYVDKAMRNRLKLETGTKN
jgi:hypothetical protein